MIKRIESGIYAKGLGDGYLSFVTNYAHKLELTGVVFAQNDGSIKVIAEGEEERLEKLSKKLERGGFFSSMENFYIKWEEPKEEFKSFATIY